MSSRKHSKSREYDSDSDDLTIFDVKKLLKECRRRKALRKAAESVEQKRRRRAAKKAAKDRRRKERSGWDQECLGYTNDDNPYGDHQLSETFVWKKKLQSEGKGHLTKEEIRLEQERLREEQQRELQAVRQRRQEREREREERQEALELEQRERETEHFRSWAQQEDGFHLEQAKLRSLIRIREGRAKPIDLLSQYISSYEVHMRNDPQQEDEASALMQLHEPTQFLMGLSAEDLEDLLEDIQVVYMQLEKGANAEYWRDIITVAKAELSEARSRDSGDPGRGAPSRSHISAPVLKNITDMLRNKTSQQLNVLAKQVQDKLALVQRGAATGVDVNYWETLQQMITVQLARCGLKERHQDFLKRKLEQLKAQHYSEDSDSGEEAPIAKGPLFPSGVAQEGTSSRTASPALAAASTSEPAATETTSSLTRETYDSGRYSPRLLDPNDDSIPRDAVIYLASEDQQRLQYERRLVSRHGGLGEVSCHEDELVQYAEKGMDPRDEAQFSVTVPVVQPTFLWSDKYRPRKPRFFNRVHTGYDWNKYNQTHYDVDNPPPKIVQGYKFNIFYPDLIDPTNTPNYTVTPCEDEPDFAVLKFAAGPPYEDIAFKVVNREWDCSYRHGFRCQFQNHVFQLWFKFTRYRYRR